MRSTTDTLDRASHGFTRIHVTTQTPAVMQQKSIINRHGDVYEQEANRIAAQVTGTSMRSSGNVTPLKNLYGSAHSNMPISDIPATVNQTLASPGRPLDHALMQDMEERFNHDFSRVRIHSDGAARQSAKDVNARAYTIGHDVVFGTGEFVPGTQQGKQLIAHELTHVVQQVSPNQSGVGPTSFLQRQTISDKPQVPQREVKPAKGSKLRRTVIKIEVVGHASPRWRAAKTPQIADELNWSLAEKRANAVALVVQRLMQDLLPNNILIFEYRYRPCSDAPPAEPLKALDELTDVSLDFKGHGSTQTLEEAGRRGRKTNDDSMRRVVVKVTMHSQTETVSEKDVKRSERKTGATRKWGISVVGQTGVGVIGKIGAICIRLLNRKTGQVGTYVGHTAGVGVDLGVKFAEASLGDYVPFTTPMPMSFADFNGAAFSLWSSGASIGVAGYESSEFEFKSFVGEQPVPTEVINVGGWTVGGVELNVLSCEGGAMYLTDNPSEQYTEVTHSKSTQTYEALASQSTTHRVFFATEADQVSAWESDRLYKYLVGIVNNSGL